MTNTDHHAALSAWVSKVNRMAAEIDAAARSMHPSAWHEVLAPDFDLFRKLAAGGPVDPNTAPSPDAYPAQRLATNWPIGQSSQLASPTQPTLWESSPDDPHTA